jgi:hypothetical protein
MLPLFIVGSVAPLVAQLNTGELHITVSDRGGRVPNASLTVSGDAVHYHDSFVTDASGEADLKILPFGVYVVRVTKPGFASRSINVEVRSSLPQECSVRLSVAQLSTTVQVSGVETLINPYVVSSLVEIGSQEIQDRLSSLPGRSVQDLVASQPGWLYEGNAVLHPRGSEYQTQFVVDGIPFTDNRSPGFGPEIEADDVASVSIYTAGFPAEYGRKMGGVVELNTRRDTDAGLHGQLVLSGGSYATAASFGEVQYREGKDTYGASASGSMTSHYLNPVVPENYTNTGTSGDFSGSYEHDFQRGDHLRMEVRHELSRFLIPNEVLQEQAGQRQHGDNFETVGTVSYQRTVSPEGLATFAGMVRDNANDLASNAASTPILAFQHNHFREGYFKSTYSYHHGHQEFKAGIESDNLFLRENFNYEVTDPTQFDPDTPAALAFSASRPDLEQAGFVEDRIHFGNWTANAGLRYDHYQLLLNQFAFSPRLSLGRYIPSAGLMLHVSFDRVFQTPSSENILISGSPKIDALSSQFLRLPVAPSRGFFYEGGVSKGLASRARVDVNVYRRDVSNYADDDQLLNTGVSYPIAFRKGIIYGAEGKFELLHLGKFSGFVSYSYMVGNVWFPVTGGLFLSDDAANALTQVAGHFPDSQDQRNTASTRFRYAVTRRVWVAAGASFGSGLPFEYTGDESDALAEYGPRTIDRLNFARGRILPVLTVDATVAAELYKNDRFAVRLQADGENLSDRLDVIDFGGLFSGNAIGPARSFALRLNTTF